MTLTPVLTTTPSTPPTYSPSIAETYSWVPIQNDVNRPLYAKAVYVTNPSSTSAGTSSVDVTPSINVTNTLLSTLTAQLVDHATFASQSALSSIATGTNTILNSLTAAVATSALQSINNTLTNNLTSIVAGTNTLLRYLTGNDSSNTGSFVVNTLSLSSVLLIKSSAGRLHSLNGYNSKNVPQFIQIYNISATNAQTLSTAVPIGTFTAQATADFAFTSLSRVGIPLTVGIAVGNSSTQATRTSGANDCWFTAVAI